MQKIYLDTNIYLDYFENRTNGLRPLGDFAFNLIKRAIECEFEIVISDLIMAELEKRLEKSRIKELLNTLKDKLIHIVKSEEDVAKLIRISNIEDEDCMHIILAKKGKADLIVTRNIKHFRRFSHLLRPVLPENI